jgi:ABC-type glycerol-3-phosphate transport system permease component
MRFPYFGGGAKRRLGQFRGLWILPVSILRINGAFQCGLSNEDGYAGVLRAAPLPNDDKMHLTNGLVAVVIGITFRNLPFVIWILKPFFDSLPREIGEAAQLDGISPFGIFWRFAIPLAGPALKTVALFSFIAAWTDLLIPITMSTRPDGWTLTAGVAQMQTGFKIYWGALMAGGLYLTLPSFVIAVAMQKSLTRGFRTTL